MSDTEAFRLLGLSVAADGSLDTAALQTQLNALPEGGTLSHHVSPQELKAAMHAHQASSEAQVADAQTAHHDASDDILE